MSKSLIIVESPAKIKTLRKFLGKDFIFESSIGHIRDLPTKGLGIDVENDFEPTYETLPDKETVIQNLKKAAKGVSMVYLSPDPDREGEAIAWHIASILPKNTPMKRISFQSITKSAVQKALEIPRDIDMDLVDAQQARRLLDRIVGYKISPILTRRVKRGQGGTSAGRVQSVALKLVVDREKDIEAFTPVEFWNLGAILEVSIDHPPLIASLHSVDGLKVEKEPTNKPHFLISNEETATQIADKLKAAAYHVGNIDKKEKKRSAPPPFITSTLQQEASRHYGFSVSRTMRIAQDLYEGIDLGTHGSEGLITYMRTDSVNIAPEALTSARKAIQERYGAEYLPEKPRVFASKKSAQEAHEAIRPSSPSRDPESIRSFITEDQYKIYRLIYRRFLASQMNPAVYDTVSVDIETDQKLLLRASGSTLKFKGYLAVYQEKRDADDEEEDGKTLPPIELNTPLQLVDVSCDQSFTKPPPRFTEASLVKELERLGIGRPSTYAAIMNKIQSRDYTTKENQTLQPTELGRVICQMLEENFAMIMNVSFTAQMENLLEEVAEHRKNWKELLREFWQEFYPLIEKAEKEAVVPKVTTDLDCPKCQGKLQKIWAKNRYFYGCENYPDCDYTAPIEALSFNKEDYDPNFDWEQSCPKCEAPTALRHGRFGPFLGCTKYPDCNGIINIPKKEETAQQTVPCPALGCNGLIKPRRSRFGKTFYSCTNYPDCDVIVNSLPQLSIKYLNHTKTPYVKKTKKAAPKKNAPKKATKKAPKKKASPKQPARKLSPELSSLLKTDSLSRPEAIKGLWDYIKEHNLQDPKNKRIINPDGPLAKVLGSSDPIDIMKLSSALSKHLKKT